MAGILTKEQTLKIKTIREEISSLSIDGWMCEGGPDIGTNQFFNNDLEDGFFIADYDGNILSSETKNISQDLKEFARLKGKICRVCGYPEYQEEMER